MSELRLRSTCLILQVMGYLKRRKIPKYFQKVVLDYYSYMSDRLSQDSIIQELPQTIQVTNHLRVQHQPLG